MLVYRIIYSNVNRLTRNAFSVEYSGLNMNHRRLSSEENEFFTVLNLRIKWEYIPNFRFMRHALDVFDVIYEFL